MQLLVLDASVAAKWFLPRAGEPLAQEAAALLREYADGEVEFAVPGLFWSEVGNVLWKAARSGRLPQQAATQALEHILHFDFRRVSGRELARDALAFAMATGRSVYDGMYVALAVQSGATLITADERLVNSLATHWPVRWLGVPYSKT